MTTYTQVDTLAQHSDGFTGEPDALKGASPVRRGAVGKVLSIWTVTRWLPTLRSAGRAARRNGISRHAVMAARSAGVACPTPLDFRCWDRSEARTPVGRE